MAGFHEVDLSVRLRDKDLPIVFVNDVESIDQKRHRFLLSIAIVLTVCNVLRLLDNLHARLLVLALEWVVPLAADTVANLDSLGFTRDYDCLFSEDFCVEWLTGTVPVLCLFARLITG
jgi:hypothetical protein